MCWSPSLICQTNLASSPRMSKASSPRRQDQQSQQSQNPLTPKGIALRARRADARLIVDIPSAYISTPSVCLWYTENDVLELLQDVFTQYLIEAHESQF